MASVNNVIASSRLPCRKERGENNESQWEQAVEYNIITAYLDWLFVLLFVVIIISKYPVITG